MKQGTQFALPVEIGMSLDEVSRIEFVFKQKSCKGFPAIKSNVWPDDCTRQEGQNIILIPWTRAETYKFMGGETLYMDTRITLRDSTDQPQTEILPTAKKLMQKDVTIRKIPQYEVSNDSNGYTLIIGEEYYNAQ